MTSTADEQLRSGASPDAGPPPAPAASRLRGVVDGRPSPPGGARFRPEIEGLRAIASALVVLYHVWIGRVSGGVDVFFVLTGFLATGQLLRASARGGIDVVDQWGRTLRRLVPPAVVVLLGTVVAALAFLPESRWPQTIREVVASALFTENWKLAADSVDYYAAHNTASVVQHFWSLSIQGQFALVFPLLVLAAVVLARRRGIGSQPAIAALLTVITLGSFAYSVHLTAVDQQLAYFHSLTRVWEFTLGGLLTLVIARIRLPVVLGVAAGWLGVLGLAACGLVLDVEGGFPGYLALWPVACAAGVLVAGNTGHRLGADRLLSSRPLQYLGSISFPLYLWHWPVLLLALQVGRHESPGWILGVLVIATSLALAAATRELVEKPLVAYGIGRRSRWGGYGLAAAVLAPLMVATLVWQAVTVVRSEPSGVPGDADHPGAMALAPGATSGGSSEAAAIPPAVSAYNDWVSYKNGCATVPQHPALDMCDYVPAASPTAKTIVVVGDSHMQQFLPAVAPIARQNGWRVRTLIRPGCPFSTTSESNLGEVDCINWNKAAIAELRESRPALVVAQATHNVRAGRTESTPPGFVGAWKALGEAGVPLLAVRDNPRYAYSPPSCLDSWGRHAPECDVPRTDLYAGPPPVPPAGRLPNVSVLDTADSLCDRTLCRPEVGNVNVYLDDNHLTATFTASLAPLVGSRIAAIVGR